MSGRGATRFALGLLAGAATLVAPAAAGADERIVAGAGNRYLTTTPSIDQGERLTFQNQDVARHDVTAAQNGADGQPLFASELIGQGQEVEVVGARFLTTGSYGFFCTIHPFMTGTLTVTSAGTPLPRPGGGGGGGGGDGTPPPTTDTTAPEVGVVLQRRVSRGRLTLTLTSDEAVRAIASATARVGGRTVRLGVARASLPAGRRTVPLQLSRSARRALRGRRSVVVSVRMTASDAAGNRGAASSRRKVTL